MIYQELPGGYIGNLYSARMFNKTHRDIKVDLQYEGSDGIIEVIGKQPLIEKENYAVITFLIKRKSDAVKKRRTDLTIHVKAEGKQIATKKTTFIGPISN